MSYKSVLEPPTPREEKDNRAIILPLLPDIFPDFAYHINVQVSGDSILQEIIKTPKLANRKLNPFPKKLG